MLVVYMILGFASGIIAAIVAVLAGTGPLLAFAAYVLAGMVGVTCCALWSFLPQRTKTAKHAITQRG